MREKSNLKEKKKVKRKKQTRIVKIKIGKKK